MKRLDRYLVREMIVPFFIGQGAVVLMLTGLGLIPLITSVVVSILVAQRSREAREEELSDLQQILERLDALDRRLAGLESR